MLSSKRVVFVERRHHRKSGKGKVGKYGRRPKKVSNKNSSKKEVQKRNGNPHRTSRAKKLFFQNSCNKMLDCEQNKKTILQKNENKNIDFIEDDSHCSYCHTPYLLKDKEFVCSCGCKNFTYWFDCKDECTDCGGRICDHQMCPCGKIVCSEEEMIRVHSKCCSYCGHSKNEQHYECRFCGEIICEDEYHYCYEEDDYYSYFDEQQYLRDMADWARQYEYIL